MSDTKLTGEDLENALKERDLPSEGTADEKRAAVAAHDAGRSDGADDDTGGQVDQTTLDSHLDRPSTTAPGDGPADTTDPTEQASSATPDKAAAAQAGHGTVNAVVKVEPGVAATDVPKSKQRVEKYKQTRPDGTEVTVTHNIETGETKVS